ncbi:hypothetical protein [Bradyrhizobium sp. SEMIA]|uniref:hypothetical protein n=1 Tax=Bradyrhizobium sp. SEMIA TaxID=2597515 RepID=UPI0018A4D20B|nr:hypothetical protein [Bradyrhizobium sp. SEMIA]QOG20462.1 hypothetical protein FOM02_27015 [Bradyrhizobium sp. SEMIA]
MTALKSVVRASISAVNTKSLDGRDVVDRMPDSAEIHLGSGVGYGNADIAFMDTRTLAASTNESLDLAGVLTDAFGQTINAAKVKAIEIENPEASLSTLTIGAAASNTFNGPLGGATHTIVLAPGDKFVAVSRTGWVVTAGTGDLLKVANGAGGSVNYNLKVIAASS